MIKLKLQETLVNLLSVGKHLVQCVSISERMPTYANADVKYVDDIPQVQILMRSPDGRIFSAFLNQIVWKRFEPTGDAKTDKNHEFLSEKERASGLFERSADLDEFAVFAKDEIDKKTGKVKVTMLGGQAFPHKKGHRIPATGDALLAVARIQSQACYAFGAVEDGQEEIDLDACVGKYAVIEIRTTDGSRGFAPKDYVHRFTKASAEQLASVEQTA